MLYLKLLPDIKLGRNCGVFKFSAVVAFVIVGFLTYYHYDKGKKLRIFYDRTMPIIWIGGVPRSGTTLCRAMLDSHPDVRCGQETRVIPRILARHAKHFHNDTKEGKRLTDAGLTRKVLNDALASYIVSIVLGHGAEANRYCNKDPFTLTHLDLIREFLPNSKFILMIRDGRSVAHSLKTRKVTITGWNIKTYKGALAGWNRSINIMWTKCRRYRSQCLPVWYEKLILDPEKEMRRILRFLDLRWDERVLHHEEMIGRRDGVVLAPKEPSTSQVKQPIHMEALHRWVSHIPQDLAQRMDRFAPMLRRLGYDPNANPPDYIRMKTKGWL